MISSVAAKLGVSKSDLLDPTSSDAAVKQAHAETHVINETKSFLTANGINLAAFSNKPRDDKVLLLKNFPYGTKPDELRKLLQEFGDLAQLLFPPAGTIAIAEFLTAPAARAAFTGLSYRRFKDGILFLEKAPLGLFTGRVSGTNPAPIATGIDARPSASDLHSTDSTTDSTATTPTLFVRNLSFTTTADGFTAAFSALDGFQWARVKTKIDPRKPGQTLSMGFGFVGFSTAAQAAIALAAMDGYNLDGHRLLVKGAHKGADAAAETKASDAAKSDAMKGTKVIIKNLPFEVTKRDVRELFGYAPPPLKKPHPSNRAQKIRNPPRHPDADQGREPHPRFRVRRVCYRAGRGECDGVAQGYAFARTQAGAGLCAAGCRGCRGRDRSYDQEGRQTDGFGVVGEAACKYQDQGGVG